MRRLLLVRHAPTAAVRASAFGADEPLDERGVVAAGALAARLPARAEVLVSPLRRAVETAAGLTVSRVEPALAECDFGSWAGRTLKELAETSPDDVQAWMTDPDAAPHGGESLSALLARVRGWLVDQAALDGTAVAVTHGGVISAAVVIALDAPPSAIWRVDVSPLSITEMHAHDGRWTVSRVNDRGERAGDTAAAVAEAAANGSEAGAATTGGAGPEAAA